MAIKKALGLLLACILPLACACPAAADGAAADQLEVEQYEICLPQIDVYFHPLSSDGTCVQGFAPDASGVMAVLGNQALMVDSIGPYTGGTAYYFLLDISGSVPKSVFSAVKESLAGFVGGMKEDDALVLITFGEQVAVVLDGTESKTDALTEISALEANDSITRFYDALSAAIDLTRTASGTLPSRRVALVFTDGKDVSEGGGTTAAEAGKSLVSAGLPIYAFGIGTNKTYLDALGALARSAGGVFTAIDKESCETALSATRERIDSCYVLHLHASSNIIEAAEQQLIVKIACGGKTLSVSKSVKVDDWVPDTAAPYVDDFFISGAHELTLEFSEAVLNAGDAANYSVTMTPEDGTAQEIAVQSAAYDDAAHTVKLTFGETLYTGDYDLSLINITDRSMEKNPLGAKSVQGRNLAGQTPPSPAPVGQTAVASPGLTGGNGVFIGNSAFPFWLVIAAGGAAAVIAVFVIVLAAKKKPKEDPEPAAPYIPEAPANTGVHIPGASGVRCQAYILDASGVQRRVEFTAFGPYTVGRSQGACDMAIDDKKLSRSHFRLTFEEGRVFIEDLGSTNGTEVNGVPVGGKRALAPTDIVTAGNTKFSFTLIG